MIAIRLTFGVGFLLSALFAATQAQAVVPKPVHYVEYNVSSQTEDYINDNWRQYNATIANFEAQIATQKSIFLAQLNVLDVQNQLIELKLQDSYEKLLPLELLSTITKYCVQKHRGQMPSSATVTQLKQCVLAARSYESSLLSSCNSNLNTLSYYYKSTLPIALNNCKKNSPDLGFNYTICATNVISAANAYTANMRKTFANNIRNLQCSIDNRITYAIDCAFGYAYNITASIGQTELLIDECVLDELQHPCPQSCDFSVDLPYGVIGITNVTIKNPFYGLNKYDFKCLKVNFYSEA